MHTVPRGRNAVLVVKNRVWKGGAMIGTRGASSPLEARRCVGLDKGIGPQGDHDDV